MRVEFAVLACYLSSTYVLFKSSFSLLKFVGFMRFYIVIGLYLQFITFSASLIDVITVPKYS